MEKSYFRLSCGSGGGSFVHLVDGVKQACSVVGCERVVKCKALCQPHYYASRYKPKPRAEKEQIRCRFCSGFFTPRSGQKHCGDACRNMARRVPNPTCKNCGVEYRAKAANRSTYCSRACTFDAKHKAQKENYLPQSAVYFKTCANCAKLWTARKANGTFCSVACSNAAAKQAYPERAREAHAKAAREVKCAGCEGKFCPMFGSRNSKCCAPCFESAARAYRAIRRDKRKAIYAANKLDPFVVFDRDGWCCKECGSPTPKSKRGTYDDDAPELDHVKPLSKGGAHSYENTQCLCRRCNSEKSDTWQPQGVENLLHS